MAAMTCCKITVPLVWAKWSAKCLCFWVRFSIYDLSQLFLKLSPYQASKEFYVKKFASAFLTSFSQRCDAHLSRRNSCATAQLQSSPTEAIAGSPVLCSCGLTWSVPGHCQLFINIILQVHTLGFHCLCFHSRSGLHHEWLNKYYIC